MEGVFMYNFSLTRLYRLSIALLLGILFALPALADCHEETQPTYSSAIELSEILPNPTGSDTGAEFIELYNTSNQMVDLTDWQLSDATTKMYHLSGNIPAHGYVVVYSKDSGITLNNTIDTVELFHPDDTLLDNIDYDASGIVENVSFIRQGTTDWKWTTTLTPGSANHFTALDDASEIDDKNADEDTTDDSGTDSETSEVRTGKVILSELLPDPTGNDSTDEWIEIYNADTKSVTITDWKLSDQSKTYTLPDLTLAAGQFQVFSVTASGISLNNSGETITLQNANSETLSTVTYGKATSGQSYAQINDNWQWTTTLTPGTANIITTTTASEVAEDETNDSINTINQHYTISEAKALDKGQAVEVMGTVSVLPGVFGAQYFYVQDDSAGIQIYSSKKSFPNLAVGDVVTIAGEISVANGETRINITAASDITTTDQQQNLSPVILEALDSTVSGKLVQVSGMVVSRDHSTIELDTSWTIYLKRGTNIAGSSFAEQSSVSVAGILISNNDGTMIFPRSDQDITTPEIPVVEHSSAIIPAAQAKSVDGTGQDYHLSDLAPPQLELNAATWIGIIISVVIVMMLLSRSERVRQWCLKKIGDWARVLAARCHRSVVVEKSTKDSNVPNQYHVQSPLERKMF